VNALQRIIAGAKIAFSSRAANQFASAVVNQYEAGQRWSDRRSWLPGWVRDARFDADSATRLEMLRKARYFERNNALVNRLLDLLEQYTVGTGLVFVPASQDDEWNTFQRQWFLDWCRYPDKQSLQTFGVLQSLIVRSWAVDGEVFVQKTRGRTRRDGQSFPRVTLIESQRVETPPDLFGDERVIDGIRLNDDDRPETYYVRSGYGTGERYDEVPASDMIHVFEPTRPGMFRGITHFYPVMNDLHDLDDLHLLTLDGAKEASSIQNIIQTKTGELSMTDLRRMKFNVGTAGQSTSGGSGRERDQYYNDIFKARIKVLRKDDEFKQYAVTRPSQSELQLWDYLTSKGCAGFGISKLLVFPWSVQGTVVRADLDATAAFFRARGGTIASKMTDVWEYVTEWGTRNVRELSDPPPDWKKVKVRLPRGVNVDVGRNSQALIAEYAAGFRTLEGICGELGEDWVEVLSQRSAELKKAAELEARDGHAPGTLVASVLTALKQQADEKIAEEQAKQKTTQQLAAV
jgi:capsid protein